VARSITAGIIGTIASFLRVAERAENQNASTIHDADGTLIAKKEDRVSSQ